MTTSDHLDDLARLIEATAPFDVSALDAFLGAPLEAPLETGADAPKPREAASARKGKARAATADDAYSPRKDRGLYPWVVWRSYCYSAPWPARAWHIRQARIRRCALLDPSDTDNARRMIEHFGADLRVRIQEGAQKPAWVAWDYTHWDDVTGGHGARRMAQQMGELIKAEAKFIHPTPAEHDAIEAGRSARATIETLRATPLPDSGKAAMADRKAEVAALMEIVEAGDEAAAALADRRAGRVKFGVSSKNAGRIEAMTAMLAPHVLIDPAAFNADPLRLATPRQTLIWSREPDEECPDPAATRYRVAFEARSGHDRRDLITTRLAHDYDPAARCPRWLAFMGRFLPDPAVRRFAQASFGLGLLGLSEQVLVFHYGEGANGKSVALEVVSRVLGPLASSLPAEAIAGDDAGGGGVKPSPEIARLFGKRFVRVSEVKEGEPLQEAFVKRITGSEAFPARALFEGYFEFRPLFIAHMSGNGYPRISGTDNGIWRRMRVVKWPVILERHEQRQFEDVVGELVAEAEGILAWLVEGASIYLAEGLVPPASVLAETQAYRDEMDSVGRFVRACVDVTGDMADQVTGRALYQAYVAWAEASGISQVKETRFGRDMRTVKGVVKEDGRVRLYRCLRLHDVPVASPRSPHDPDQDGLDHRGF